LGFVLLGGQVTAQPGSGGSPSLQLFMATKPLDPDPALQRLHDYGDAVLLGAPIGYEPSRQVARRLRRLPGSATIEFRHWRTPVRALAEDAISELPKGLYAIALLGPMDQRWRDGLIGHGLTVLANGSPYTVVVKGAGPSLKAALQLRTSEGERVVVGIEPLPRAARMARSLLTNADDRESLKLRSYRWDGTTATDGVTLEARRRSSKSTGIAEQLSERLLERMDIAYVEPATRIVLHNNLATTEPAMAAVPVWDDLQWNGAGVVVGHNDSGVDQDHPDLPPESIVATVGLMEYTDNGHGTHTAGSVAGRGVLAAPVNTSACGDMAPPLPFVRGVAWGARLAVNNIFVRGLFDLQTMMRWAVDHGAQISTNSWGLYSGFSSLRTYAAESAVVDRIVRDANPAEAGLQPLTIVFSAGNSGPRSGTVGAPGNAKNTVTVGATQNLRCGSWVPENQPGPDVDTVTSFSSRGPAQGRIKPDVVAPGADLLSAQSSEDDADLPWDQDWTGQMYGLSAGTSMSCPLVAGAAAVFVQFYRETYAAEPSPALVKAALINGAVDTGAGYPSHLQGWGRVHLERTINGPPNGFVTFVDQRELPELVTGASWSTELEVFSSAVPLEVTLVWTDQPGEADSDHPLVNDLDLVVTGPDGAQYRGNVFSDDWSTADPGAEADGVNPVEVVMVPAPEPGPWQLEVRAAQVLEVLPELGGQDFAVVYSGDAGECRSPAAPTSVRSSATHHNVVEVSWTPVTGATEYAVYRSETQGGRPYERIATVPAPVTRLYDRGVSGNVRYYYVVRAFTDCWSAFSAESAATAFGLCHLDPEFAGLTRVEDANNVTCSLDLEWDAARSACGGEVSYSVYRDTVADVRVGPEQLIASGVRQLTYRDRGLEPGQAYYYLVRSTAAVNGASDGNVAVRSGVPSGIDQDHFVDPVEDTALWLHGPASDLDSGSVSWGLTDRDAHSPEMSWHCPDSSELSDRALTMAQPVTIPARGDGQVVLEAWHRYKVEERWDGGRLEYSTDGGFSWHDILDGDGATVAGNPNRFVAGGYTLELVGPGNTNPIGGSPAWSGHSYGWRRLAVDLGDFAGRALLLRWRLACDGQWSEEGGWWIDDLRIVTSRTCQSCLAPEAPSGLVVRPTDDGVRVSWQSVEGAMAYRVRRAEVVGGPSILVAELTGGETTYLDTDVSGGSDYGYTVEVRVDCWSAPSDEVWVTAGGECAAPPAFQGVAAVESTHQASCAIDLSWTAAENRCDGNLLYRVYRGEHSDAVEGQLLAAVEGATQWRDHTVVGERPYYYLVRAVNPTSGEEDANLRILEGTATGPEVVLSSDGAEASPSAWHPEVGSGADTGTPGWEVTDGEAYAGERAYHCAGEPVTTDQALVLDVPIEINDGEQAALEAWQLYDLEWGWDGGRLEYSVDSGASWHDILSGDGQTIDDDPQRVLVGGYSATLHVGAGTNPLAGERAWSGSAARWTPVRVDLAAFAGRKLLLRWRLGCDAGEASRGWWIDDITIAVGSECVASSDRTARKGEKAPRRPLSSSMKGTGP
jgi:subtilisin family serine protease/fibronectin type 3 domain-containing protein